MKLDTMNEKMTDEELAISKENSWLTRLAFVLADKPQSMEYDFFIDGDYIEFYVKSKIGNNDFSITKWR